MKINICNKNNSCVCSFRIDECFGRPSIVDGSLNGCYISETTLRKGELVVEIKIDENEFEKLNADARSCE